MLNRIIRFLFAILEKLLILIESLLSLRFVLRLLGANPDTVMVKFFYSLTDFLIKPFIGIFQDASIKGGVIDLVVLTAAIFYALAFFILRKIFVR